MGRTNGPSVAQVGEEFGERRLGQFDHFQVVGMIDVDARRAVRERLDLLGGELERDVVHRGGRLFSGELTSVGFRSRIWSSPVDSRNTVVVS